MDRVEQFGRLADEWSRCGLDRRRFLRLVGLGASASSLAAVIAACSSSSAPSSVSAPAQPTRPAGGAAPPAASPAAAAPSVPTPVAQTVGQAALRALPQPTSAAFIDRPMLITLNSEPDTLDVHDSFFNSSLGVDKCVHDGLVALDEKMRVVNQLAESWSPSADAKEFTFKLKSGVKFHDGTPFNAKAVKASFERSLTPDSKLKRRVYFSSVIDRVEAVDDLTVKIVAKQPFAAMVATIAHPAGGIVSPAAVEKFGADYGMNPVGTGPYRFVSWARGDRITLEANTDYWDKATGPSVAKLMIKGISEPSSLAIAVQTGDAQFAGPLNAPQAEQLRRAPGVQVIENDSISVFWITLNNSKAPFDNKLVRQALNYGVNKDQVLRAVELGKGKVIDSPLAEGVWGYNRTKSYPHDPAKAKELLTQAGLPNGFKATLWTSPVSKDRAVAVQAQLAQIGVEIEVVQMEPAALSAEINKPKEETQLQMLVSNWSPSTGDADWGIRPLYTREQWPPAGATTSFYSNPELDEFLKQGLQFTDETKRKEAYAKAQALLMEEVPNIYLYAPTYFAATRDNVGGLTVQADGIIYMRTAHYKS